MEKGGAIRIVKDGALLPTPFLDLAGQVSTGSEQGLLGLAFDPAYATNGRFVVHYTDVKRATRVVSVFRVSAGDPDLADPASESVILTAEQPFANHNGGQILFGPMACCTSAWATAAAAATQAGGASRWPTSSGPF